MATANKKKRPETTPPTDAIVRGPGGRFVKGARSPNPGGRPEQLKEIQSLARKHGPEAIAMAARLMRSHPDGYVRLKAIELLLARGFGNVPQKSEGSSPMVAINLGGGPVVTAEQAAAVYQRMIADPSYLADDVTFAIPAPAERDA